LRKQKADEELQQKLFEEAKRKYMQDKKDHIPLVGAGNNSSNNNNNYNATGAQQQQQQ